MSASILAPLPALAAFALTTVEASSGLPGRLASADSTVNLSITLVDEAEIRRLNNDYRGIDEPTDVLSFPCDGHLEQAGEPILLGDIVIAPAQTDDIELMVVHGLLHVLGYDHETDEDAALMEALSDDILSAWRCHGQPASAAVCR
ncbi:MAG: rRNA maturation RNase YbeY [Actinomycetes bacterium]|nr:rRNA maturation RNase YbeY [Actinomycetes bacterium]